MSTYIIRRLIIAVLLLFIITLTIFLIMRLLPGDPIVMLLTTTQQQSYTKEQIEKLRHEFGLDKPIIVQYGHWIKGVIHGDLGSSILDRSSVSKEIVRRFPITLHMGGLAFILGNVIGIPAGIICAVKRGKWQDSVITALANLGITIPNFWLAILLMYAFGLYLKWLPVMGYTSPFHDFELNTRQIIMPVICECLFPLASIARQTRSSMLEVLHQDYIRTAWSKGLREQTILMRHAIKNGLIPIVTLAGMGIPMVIGGTVFIETIFNIPGVGRLLVASVLNHDYPFVQGITLIIAIVIVLTNLLVDIAYGWLDPRIRFG